MKKRDNREGRRGGFYWFEGNPFASVTKVLQVIDKPALRHWIGREVYRAVVKDPSISEQQALSAPYNKVQAGAERGSAVHSIVETWETTGKILENVPEPYKPYANAFYKWINDNHIELVEHERTVVSKVHKYAGTLDLIVKQKGNGLWIIDVKTGKDIYKEAHIQLSAYQHALKEEAKMDIKRTGVLLLQSTGNYKFEETADVFNVFLACLELWKFVNNDECTDFGYTKEENENLQAK